MKVITAIDKLGSVITSFFLARPYVSIIFCLTIVAACVPGLLINSIASDHRAFFGPENPQLLAYDEIEETYTKLDNLVFVIHTPGKKALDPETYPIIQEITEESWNLPFASRVDSLSNYQHTSAEQDDLIVEDFLDLDQTYSEQDLKDKEAIALAEPLLAGSVLALDGGASAVSVSALFTENLDNDIVEFVGEARKLGARMEEKYPGTRIAITGTATMSLTFSEAGETDASTLIPGMYVMLLIALLCVYRSLTATLVTFAVVSTATIVPLGVFGYSGTQLTSLSLVAPVIIMTLAVADSVHILVTQLNLMRDGMGKISALRESMRLNFLAVAVTSITTIIGFLCLNFSDTPPYHHLGNISALGIFCAWFFSVVLLPALVVVLPMKVKPRQSESGNTAQTSMRALANFTTRNYRSILVISLFGSVALISQLPKLEFNDQFIQFFDHRVPFRTDTDYIQEHLGGAFYINYHLQSGEEQGINNPGYLQQVDAFADWARAHPLVTSVFSFSDIAKRLNKNMHGDDPAFLKVPDNRELAAQYLLLYELSLPYGLGLTDRINLDKSATRMTVILDNPTAEQMRNFAEESSEWLTNNAGESLVSKPTGTALLFAYISQRNIESMISGNTIAIIAIALVLVLALNHLGLGLLSMLPNLLPVILALSIWAIFVGMAGMATTIVAASSLGIVVDNTTHFLSKYLRARREKKKNKTEAIAYSFETVGIAIIANAIVLIFGFSILAFSTFLPNFQMGILTAMTITLALIIDLICLPALLMLGGDKQNRDQALPA